MPALSTLPAGVALRASSPPPDADRVLTPAAIEFVAHFARAYGPRVDELLARRARVQAAFDAGARPHFLPSTAHVRAGNWTVAPLPADIRDRRVEITGPVDRKMVINALNSGASVFMADFEDSNAPTWANQVGGQANLMDAVRGTIAYTDPKTGKRYALSPHPAVLFVRPRGWHLPEAHFVVDGAPCPGALFDFALFFFHNAKALVSRGSGPYFYLPKMQSHLEARLWNDVFLDAQHRVGLPPGTIKATVLIETLPAAFEMDEILYELRDHSAGLNCGRWDYIFSLIKTLREDPGAVVPDRGDVTMTQPCMAAYSKLLIKTCHRRKVHAMGGMAAQIPIKVRGGRGRKGGGSVCVCVCLAETKHGAKKKNRLPSPPSSPSHRTTTPPTRPPWPKSKPTRRGRRRTGTTGRGWRTPRSSPSPRPSLIPSCRPPTRSRPSPASTWPSRRPTCWPSRPATGRRPPCATTAWWGCSTSRRGCAATAASRSST